MARARSFSCFSQAALPLTGCALPVCTMPSHLWMANLDEEAISVFATAFNFSREKGFRVSTERFLASLPQVRKVQMMRLCEAAQNECNMTAPHPDVHEPISDDWQQRICFSTCIESTLHKCGPGTSLVMFLRLLCTNASLLHCIADRNLPVEAYLTDTTRGLDPPAIVIAPFAPPPAPPLHKIMVAPDPYRWQRHGASLSSIGELLNSDVLGTLMSMTDTIDNLRKCKVVCKSWRQAARLTLCDQDWLCERRVTIHDMLKKGVPSPYLVLKKASRQPHCMLERDHNGLLSLQYASAWRMDAALVTALRKATSVHVGWGASLACQAVGIQRRLRHVNTRTAHAPIV